MDILEADSLEDGSDEEGEAMTAAEVLAKLEEVWLNEKFSPELLENKSELVECMLEQVHEMEDNIRRTRGTDFKVHIHRMELDRIRYILSSYLRIRLRKVEKFTSHLLEQENNGAQKLTPEELQYAREYKETMDLHMKTLALQHMPSNLQALDPKQTNIAPKLDNYVFMKVNDDTEGVMVEEETTDSREEIIDLTKGDQHIILYRPITELVASGAVSLI